MLQDAYAFDKFRNNGSIQSTTIAVQPNNNKACNPLAQTIKSNFL